MSPNTPRSNSQKTAKTLEKTTTTNQKESKKKTKIRTIQKQKITILSNPTKNTSKKGHDKINNEIKTIGPKSNSNNNNSNKKRRNSNNNTIKLTKTTARQTIQQQK